MFLPPFAESDVLEVPSLSHVCQVIMLIMIGELFQPRGIWRVITCGVYGGEI